MKADEHAIGESREEAAAIREGGAKAESGVLRGEDDWFWETTADGLVGEREDGVIRELAMQASIPTMEEGKGGGSGYSTQTPGG